MLLPLRILLGVSGTAMMIPSEVVNTFALPIWMIPTRVIKGAYGDAVRRARSFRELDKRGKAYSDKPQIRRIAIACTDSRDWGIEDRAIKMGTHLG